MRNLYATTAVLKQIVLKYAGVASGREFTSNMNLVSFEPGFVLFSELGPWSESAYVRTTGSSSAIFACGSPCPR